MVSPQDLVAPAPDPLTADPAFQALLDAAVVTTATNHQQTKPQVPLRFAIVDITTPGPSLPFAGFRADVTDFIASEGKVIVMFAAYAMREAARAGHLPLVAFPATTPDGAASEALIRGLSQRILLAKKLPSEPNPTVPIPLTDAHRLPRYATMLTQNGTTVDFTPAYDGHLDKMIVESDDESTAECIHGIGYSFLNGALELAGFFDDALPSGLWIAGDYREATFSSREKYPAVRIPADNDVDTAQGGTARQMARLAALIATGQLLGPAASGEMMARLTRSARNAPGQNQPFDPPFISRQTSIPASCVVANKLGVNPLKNNHDCFSEVSVLAGVGRPERRYVVAWQNLDLGRPYRFTDVATIVRETILGREKLLPP